MSVHVIARESPFTYHWFLSSFLLCPLPQRTVMGSGGWPEDLQVISDFFCLLASCWLSNFFWVKKRKLSCRRVETSTTKNAVKIEVKENWLQIRKERHLTQRKYLKKMLFQANSRFWRKSDCYLFNFFE